MLYWMSSMHKLSFPLSAHTSNNIGSTVYIWQVKTWWTRKITGQPQNRPHQQYCDAHGYFIAHISPIFYLWAKVLPVTTHSATPTLTLFYSYNPITSPKSQVTLFHPKRSWFINIFEIFCLHTHILLHRFTKWKQDWFYKGLIVFGTT